MERKFIEILENWKNNDILKPLMVVGARQIGKTYLINKFCESKFPYKIICAGSLLGVKLKRFKKVFPVGKVTITYMFPMDFEEFLIATGNKIIISEIKRCFKTNQKMSEPLHYKLLKFYRYYLCIGGMPEIIKNFIDNNLSILSLNNQNIKSIIDSYIADMKKHTNSESETIKIEKVYKNIPSQLAKENKKFQYGKVDKNARKREYESPIEWLVSSNMVLLCYYVNKFETPLKGFAKEDNFKLYLSDVGLLTTLLEIPYNKIMLDEDFMYKGVLAENYVAQTLVANGYSIYYWSLNQVAEIDFLIDTPQGIIPIEVKVKDNVSSKSLNYYIKNNTPNYAIGLSTKNFGFENNVKSVPLYAAFCIDKTLGN